MHRVESNHLIQNLLKKQSFTDILETFVNKLKSNPSKAADHESL